MLVDVHENLVCLRALVALPNLDLGKLHPVQGLSGLSGASEGQGLRVGEDAAQGFYPAPLTLNVGWRSEMAAGIIHPDYYRIAGLELWGLFSWRT